MAGKLNPMITRLMWLACLTSLPVCHAHHSGDVSAEIDSLSSLITTNRDAAEALISQIDVHYEELDADQQQHFLIMTAGHQLVSSQHEAAIETLDRVLSYPGLAPNYRMRANTFLAHVQYLKGHFNTAFEHLYTALTILPSIPDNTYTFSTLHTAATIHNEVQAFDDAIAYANQALGLFPEGSMPKETCYALQARGTAQSYAERYASAEVSLNQARELCHQIGEPIIEANILKMIAYNELALGQTTRAIDTLKQAMAISDTFPYQPDRVHMESLMARAYLTDGQTELARDYAQRVLEQASKLDLAKRQQEAYALLSRIHGDAGEYQQALAYSNALIDSNNRTQNDLQTRHLAYLIAKYDNLAKSSQIEKLKLASEVSDKSRTNAQLLSITTIIILGIAVFWLLRIRQQKLSFKQLSETDSLTGAYNRRQILQQAESAFALARSQHSDLTTVLVDLDNFKRINDQFGHATGDWALTRVTEAISQCIGNLGTLGRTGGEEFLILLPHHDRLAAVAVAERARKAIAEIDTAPSGQSFQISASFGVATCCELDRTVDTQLNRSDIALYQAKSDGRNRVNVHSGNPEPLAREA